MKPFRRNRRPGNRPMTPEQRERICEAKIFRCIPCHVWAAAGNMPEEHVATCSAWNHTKSGNIRRGHDHGYAGCDWHHQRILPDGWTFERMTKHFGPSLMDGSKLFARTYGTDDELIALQHRLQGTREAA